ncbi:MAG TPA: FtsQ-type POTRA domain-containing protein [Clostridia bacterium]|nr:FtsQ-type POTRA domain-containing protein [Clostridia bacterium]
MRKKYIAIAISVVMIALIITFGQIFTVRNVMVQFKNETGIATENSILEIADIKANSNIFNVRESKIKESINTYYANSLVVNIERTFPNTVIIHVKERLPMFSIEANTDTYEGYVYTDMDFQRSGTLDEINSVQLINVINYTVKNTFDTQECIDVRSFVSTLYAQGLEESSIVAFVENITINEDSLTVKLRQNNAVIIVNRVDVSSSTTQLYNSYLSLSIPERMGVTLHY